MSFMRSVQFGGRPIAQNLVLIPDPDELGHLCNLISDVRRGESIDGEGSSGVERLGVKVANECDHIEDAVMYVFCRKAQKYVDVPLSKDHGITPGIATIFVKMLAVDFDADLESSWRD